MVEKVTLWRASNGDHFNSQAEAQHAEAYDELDTLLAAHGLSDVIPALTAAILHGYDNVVMETGSDILRAYISSALEAEKQRRSRLTGKGRAVEKANVAELTRPTPVPVQAPVRRRAIGHNAVPALPPGDARPFTQRIEDLPPGDVEMETPMAMHGNEMLPSGPDRPRRPSSSSYGIEPE